MIVFFITIIFKVAFIFLSIQLAVHLVGHIGQRLELLGKVFWMWPHVAVLSVSPGPLLCVFNLVLLDSGSPGALASRVFGLMSESSRCFWVSQ